MYAYITSYSDGAGYDEAWEKQHLKKCPECRLSYPQQSFDRIEYKYGAFDKSVVFGFLDELLFIRNDFLNLLPELKTFSLSCDLCNAKTGKIESEWTILSRDPCIHIRGNEKSSCWICPSCKRVFYSDCGNSYVMSHEMNNIPAVAPVCCGMLLREDIYQRLRNTPEWGRMKRKLSVQKLPVLEIPEDFFPVELESLPEEFYLDRKSQWAIVDIQNKYDAFRNLFYPRFPDG